MSILGFILRDNRDAVRVERYCGIYAQDMTRDGPKSNFPGLSRNSKMVDIIMSKI